jgi:CRISPR-associated protein Csx17
MTEVALKGCSAEPLGSYLKALAVLRLVSEQADCGARGWWGADCFHLESALDQQELVDFFLTRYAPTPILAPWNGGSGFYPKDRQVGIKGIEESSDQRFATYREAVRLARAIPEVGEGKGDSQAKEDERRETVLRVCRNSLPDGCVDWLDAAVGISAEGKRAFAPILGTGGNEGRLDYTNNFMERLVDLLVAPDPRTPVAALLQNALLGVATGGFQPGSVGQYDPGRAGGFNQGQGVEQDDFPSNPWNFVLTFEGAVAWAAGLYRRQGVAYRSFLCSPFTVRSTPVGYDSAAAKDEALARAEIWVPLWERPARYAEVKALLREGRAAVEAKPARNGMEFAEAACMLGVDRGLSGFLRYSLLKRRGDSYIALPAGRFRVTERRETDLVRQMQPLLEEADWQLRGGPAEYASLRRQVDDATYSLLVHGGQDAVQGLAVAFGRLHRWILTMGKPVRFSRRLGPEWLTELQATAEARIAASLAGIWHSEVGAFQVHLDRNSRQFAWHGGTLAERMTRTLERRVLMAETLGVRRNALGSTHRASAKDAVLFLEGSVDDAVIEELLFAYTLVDLRRGDRAGPHNADDVEAWPVYALLKHLFLSGPVPTPEGDVYVSGDLTALAALAADDIEQAARVAIRRLQNAGLSPIEADYSGGFNGMRLAASLLIPVPYNAALRQVLRSGGMK